MSLVLTGCALGESGGEDTTQTSMPDDDAVTDGSGDDTPSDSTDGDAEAPDSGDDLDESEGDDENEAAPDRRVEEPPDPSEATIEMVASLPGRLAVMAGGSLTVLDAGGTGLVTLDDGAETRSGQPVWFDDGSRLVWVRVSDAGSEVVVADVVSGEQVATALPGAPAFYLQWSPDGRAVAYLRNSADGRGVELGVVAPGEGVGTIGAVAPFFISWPLDGSSALAAHIGGTQVVLLDDPLSALADEAVTPEVLLEPTGLFSTPAFLDARTVLAAGTDGLVIIDTETGQTQSAVRFDGAREVQFVVSPDRRKLAYQLVRGQAGPSAASFATDDAAQGQGVDGESGLVVVDLQAETTEIVTNEPAVRWEWSPDSGRLAWLEVLPSDAQRLARWNFWSDDGRAAVTSAVYEPSDVVIQAYLPFFEQYTHSITGWSPDNSAFAFAGRHESEGPDAADSIWVQLIDGDTDPVRIGDGDVVTWGR